jgi:hypothetical protein
VQINAIGTGNTAALFGLPFTSLNVARDTAGTAEWTNACCDQHRVSVAHVYNVNNDITYLGTLSATAAQAALAHQRDLSGRAVHLGRSGFRHVSHFIGALMEQENRRLASAQTAPATCVCAYPYMLMLGERVVSEKFHSVMISAERFAR